jgi:hypothetical protein
VAEHAEADLFTTFEQADAANVYELALRWADVTRHPHPKVGADHRDGLVPSTVATELDQVATMAALARRLHGWLPIHLHRALLVGASVAEVAAAAGMHPFDMAVRWREWSNGQRHLQSQIPGLTDRSAEYDRVAAILATEPLLDAQPAPAAEDKRRDGHSG